MPNATRFALLLAAILLQAACGGWQLRGTGSFKLPFESAYLNAPNAPLVAQAVRTELNTRGIQVTRKRAEAQVVIDLDSEYFDRRVLSIDPNSGKVREIELGLEVYFAVRSHEGKLMIPREPLAWELDYVFDEGSLLGTVEQDSTVRRDLAETAATTLMLRLQAVQLPPSG